MDQYNIVVGLFVSFNAAIFLDYVPASSHVNTSDKARFYNLITIKSDLIHNNIFDINTGHMHEIKPKLT